MAPTARFPIAALTALLVAACGDPPATSDADVQDDVTRPQRDADQEPVDTTDAATGSGADVDADSTDTAHDGSGDDAVDSDGQSDADTTADADATEVECSTDADCDDRIFCNGEERCSLNRCYSSPIDPCDDVNPCTSDSCDEAADVCVFADTSDACGPGQLCDPKAGCYTPAECRFDSDCDDGLVCNGIEACVDDVCAPGDPVVCDDGVECTSDACLELTGGCQSVPFHSNCLPTELCSAIDDCIPRPPCLESTGCIDAFYCNGTEFCADDGLCAAGDVPDTDDGLDCTQDLCSEVELAVVHTPINARCTDGAYCNGAEICSAVTGCGPGVPPSITDAVACTIDTCDEERNAIVHTVDDARCEDGLFCNGAEVCSPVAGCQAGEPPTVNDGIGCTVDRCSEVAGAVLHVPDDLACDDALFCNGTEVCDVAVGCTAGVPPAVDDGVDCTDDRCDEATNRVLNAPLDLACSDGDPCNGAETCSALLDCRAGTEPVPDDGIDCTIDYCDDVLGVVGLPDDSLCDDEVFCNGVEICDATLGCRAGTPPVVSDGVNCTTDVCNEAFARIDHFPSDAFCSNGLFCDGAEVCDPDMGCEAGAPPVLGDAFACTVDSCDEGTDSVVHAPNNAACDDGQLCNGTETCSATLGCRDGADRADGTFCLGSPRSICNAGECAESVCGDGIRDIEFGEQCDDGDVDPGDGCDADCQNESACGSVSPAGNWAITPTASYSCDYLGIIELISFSVSQFSFALAGTTLSVDGGPVLMTQSPRADDCSFNVVGTIPGGCTEQYSLVGTFTSPTTFTATYRLQLTGGQCASTSCTNQTWTVTGTKL